MIFSTHRQAFCFLCVVIASGLAAFWGSAASESKIVEEVKIEPWRGFKGYRRKMHFCENTFKVLFSRLKDRKKSIFGKIFILLYLQQLLVTEINN